MNKNKAQASHQGIGMTSQRTRDRMVARLRDQGIVNVHVLEAMRTLPRHLFVDEAFAHRAYEDNAVPIGQHQTLSQPYMHARTTELVLQKPVSCVLEVGTGSGFQTALLSQLVDKVYSIERIEVLYTKAKQRLTALSCSNVFLRFGDGYQGWSTESVFDAIVVAAASAEIPETLLQQLAINGRLIIPLGEGRQQHLKIITRSQEGFSEQTLEPAYFVPLLSGQQKR